MCHHEHLLWFDVQCCAIVGHSSIRPIKFCYMCFISQIYCWQVCLSKSQLDSFWLSFYKLSEKSTGDSFSFFLPCFLDSYIRIKVFSLPLQDVSLLVLLRFVRCLFLFFAFCWITWSKSRQSTNKHKNVDTCNAMHVFHICSPSHLSANSFTKHICVCLHRSYVSLSSNFVYFVLFIHLASERARAQWATCMNTFFNRQMVAIARFWC